MVDDRKCFVFCVTFDANITKHLENCIEQICVLQIDQGKPVNEQRTIWVWARATEYALVI